MSIKNKYTVKSIDKYLCKEWLLHKHYAKRIPSISYAFGLFNENLIGICTFGSPPSRALCVGVCGKENAEKVLELNRLCVNEDLEKNVLSYFVSSSDVCSSDLEKKGINYKDLAIRNRPQKHRYIYFTGNKKKWLKELNYKIEPYPKGQNKRYDSSYKPKIQTQLF